ncbi:MAG: glutathione S-transferase family protein [Pseudomonadota bacterium]
MYKVHGVARNRTYRVLWALEELGAPYEFAELMPRTDACFALNPSGKVPILEDDGVVVTDSLAIMTYLADKHGALAARAGTIERAKQDSFTNFVVDEVEGALWTVSKHKFVLPKEMRVAEMRDVAKFEFDRAMDRLGARLEALSSGGPFALGDTFTITDILLGHAANWAKAVKWDLPAGEVGAYFDRVRDRPAVARLDEMHPPAA